MSGLPTDCLHAASLPVLPPAAGYLLSTLYAPDASIKTMAREIERFPGITARVLAMANSAWSAPLSAVLTLPDACTRLGLHLVRTLSIALAVANVFDPTKCPGFNAERYWVTALLAAEASTQLARGIGRGDVAPTWRCAGLFHNIGLLWLADSQPNGTSTALHGRGGGGLLARLQRALNTDYCQAGAQLAQAWGLPETYVTLIAQHRQPALAGDEFPGAAVVGVGADMAACLYCGESWSPDRMSASVRECVPEAVAEPAWRALASVLEATRTMGRMIATTV
jgi:HD-like signal output (HDOD) protein